MGIKWIKYKKFYNPKINFQERGAKNLTPLTNLFDLPYICGIKRKFFIHVNTAEGKY